VAVAEVLAVTKPVPAFGLSQSIRATKVAVAVLAVAVVPREEGANKAARPLL
jgi:hypothetical protein